jgi:hypothetical protein
MEHHHFDMWGEFCLRCGATRIEIEDNIVRGCNVTPINVLQERYRMAEVSLKRAQRIMAEVREDADERVAELEEAAKLAQASMDDFKRALFALGGDLPKPPPAPCETAPGEVVKVPLRIIPIASRLHEVTLPMTYEGPSHEAFPTTESLRKDGGWR